MHVLNSTFIAIALAFVNSVSMTSAIADDLGDSPNVSYQTEKVDGLDIFYREAGPRNAPTIVLLHGFPTSSHMFRDLIPKLADKYHVIAPDYPGYGNSSMPNLESFDYSFDNFATVVNKFLEQKKITHYSLYLMDYGAPIGFRIATAHPERINGLIIQNGNAYDEGIDNVFWEPIKEYWRDRGAINKGLDNPFWKNVKAAYKDDNLANDKALRFLVTEGATKWQYLNGARNSKSVNPDAWGHVQSRLDRAGNVDVQLQLFYSYGSNPPLYPQWQEYFRQHQPPTLIVWGEKDEIFPADGAFPYQRDLKNVEIHMLNTGHFALEEDSIVIANHMRRFLDQNNIK